LEILKGREHSEVIFIDEKIILKRSSELVLECEDWIRMAQDRGRRETSVNTVLNVSGYRLPEKGSALKLSTQTTHYSIQDQVFAYIALRLKCAKSKEILNNQAHFKDFEIF
jgi:hypothetical protein